MSMEFRKCESCRQLRKDINQFVHDPRSDDWICTLCGAVVKRWIYSERQHTFAHTAPMVPNGYIPAPKDTTKTLHKYGNNMINRFFPQEAREERLIMRLKELGDILDYTENIVSRATVKLKKFPKLKLIRPIEHTLAAILVVSKRSFGHYVNLKHVSAILGFKDLGKSVITVCSTLGLSQRSSPVSYIPRFTQLLGFEYKYVKHVKRHYLHARKKNGSIGSDTLMALVLIRFYIANQSKSKLKSKVDLNYISRITHTSKSSLKGYIEGTGGKCTLFNKKIKLNFI